MTASDVKDMVGIALEKLDHVVLFARGTPDCFTTREEEKLKDTLDVDFFFLICLKVAGASHSAFMALTCSIPNWRGRGERAPRPLPGRSVAAS